MNIEITAHKLRNIIKTFPLLESMFIFLARFLFSSIFFIKSRYSERKLHFGFCSLCGKNTLFLIDSSWKKKRILNDHSFFRESGTCLFCSANTRRRIVAELIKKIIVIKLIYKELDELKIQKLLDQIDLSRYPLKHILELIKKKDFWIYTPTSYGPIYNTLKKHPKFIFSEYFSRPELKGGQYFRGIRFEDLQSLSFQDNSIDLIITQEVFEHVEKPYMAFKEINRVLKPNGIHLFTIPIGTNKKTDHFFDDEGNLLIKHIKYHKDPLRPEGAIVFTQFAQDIIEILNDYNFFSFFYYSKINPKIGIFSKLEVIISVKIS